RRPLLDWKSPYARMRIDSLGAASDPYLLVFMFAQGQIITTDLDLDWIAHGGEADQLDWSAHQQAHLHEARPALGGQFDFGNGRGRAESNGGQRMNRARAGHEFSPTAERKRLRPEWNRPTFG